MSTNYINQITDTAGTTHDIMEGVDTRIFRATCSTAAATAAKVATLEDDTGFSLTAGVKVAVTFTYGNSATTPTLRVDGTSTGTAASVAYPSSTTAYGTGNGTTYNTWGAYETMLFTYTGTYWVHLPSGYLGYLAYYKANSNHTHGNITAGGDITAAAPTIATGDQLIMNDESASKIVNSGLTFDTTVTDAYLRRDGTWATTSSTSALTIESSPTSSSSN